MKIEASSLFIYLLLVISILFNFLISTGCGKEKEEVHFLVYADSLIFVEGTREPFSGTRTAIIEGKHLEYEVVEGIKHGSFKIFHQNGNVEILGQIENNKNTGIWKYYYEDGSLECGGKFENDKPEGKWTWYYPTGEIKEEGIFHNGKREGVWFMYDGIGNVINEKNYDSINTNK